MLAAKPGNHRPGDPCACGNEEKLLAAVTGDRERFYLEILQPFKLKGYVEYLQQRSPQRDLEILCRTALAVIFPSQAQTPEVLAATQVVGEDEATAL